MTDTSNSTASLDLDCFSVFGITIARQYTDVQYWYGNSVRQSVCSREVYSICPSV